MDGVGTNGAGAQVGDRAQFFRHETERQVGTDGGFVVGRLVVDEEDAVRFQHGVGVERRRRAVETRVEDRRPQPDAGDGPRRVADQRRRRVVAIVGDLDVRWLGQDEFLAGGGQLAALRRRLGEEADVGDARERTRQAQVDAVRIESDHVGLHEVQRPGEERRAAVAALAAQVQAQRPERRQARRADDGAAVLARHGRRRRSREHVQNTPTAARSALEMHQHQKNKTKQQNKHDVCQYSRIRLYQIG